MSGRPLIKSGLILAAWCGVLLDRAQQAGIAAMPAYTHLQRAEPVLTLALASGLRRKCFFARWPKGSQIAASG